MPSILNLKFKGNKSFIAFSNLGDVDALTKTWKVCTKVAGFLEQGQRLENLSWRLWHLQNLMVDTDNARSKREFRKLSKTMGDKLDKEKGRSIEELEAPGFKRNHSTDLIKQRAVEKERSREAAVHTRPGTIKRMQFTFSVDQPSQPPSAQHVDKPDFKPSSEFKDSRRRPSTRAAAASRDISKTDTTVTTNVVADDTKDNLSLTQRGRKQSVVDTTSADEFAALRFGSLFSSDFSPSALLNPTPTLSSGNSYGEGVRTSSLINDTFSVVRPTIELPLDEILNEASPSPAAHDWAQPQDVQMDTATTATQETFDVRSALARSAADSPPQATVSPSKLGPQISTTLRPVLNVRTQTTQPAPAPAPPASSRTPSNSAPGGAKAECSNCGATHTPLWRRGLNDELNCNACGLYCKLHKRPRPKTMRNSHVTEARANAATAARQEPVETIPMAQCYNCHTTTTPLWRKDEEGKTVCNACGLYYKLHGSARPISMKSDVIRKRSRHDARRAGQAASETPSASPGASRRASPNSGDPNGQLSDSPPPMGSVDAMTGLTYDQGQVQQSVQQQDAWHTDSGFGDYGGFIYPGPYHPDYLAQMFASTATGTTQTSDDVEEEARASKRRRLSCSSATEPPSSAVSYASSYSDASSSTAFSEAASTSTTYSEAGATDYSFGYGAYGMRGSTFWHPPMLPPTHSPQFVPASMDEHGGYGAQHQVAQHKQEYGHHEGKEVGSDGDSLFSTYLHPPMILPDDHAGAMYPHPPMFPADWDGAGAGVVN